MRRVQANWVLLDLATKLVQQGPKHGRAYLDKVGRILTQCTRVTGIVMHNNTDTVLDIYVANHLMILLLSSEMRRVFASSTPIASHGAKQPPSTRPRDDLCHLHRLSAMTDVQPRHPTHSTEFRSLCAAFSVQELSYWPVELCFMGLYHGLFSGTWTLTKLNRRNTTIFLMKIAITGHDLSLLSTTTWF